jgi:predicted metal-dependent hydrolase
MRISTVVGKTAQFATIVRGKKGYRAIWCVTLTQNEGTQGKFERGIIQFNSRHFFEAHETWEEIWLAAPQPEKTFLQGIIQVAAAFHHYHRGNSRGAQSLLRSGILKLIECPENYRGVDVESLRDSARGWAEALSDGKDPGAEQLPKIKKSAAT